MLPDVFYAKKFKNKTTSKLVVLFFGVLIYNTIYCLYYLLMPSWIATATATVAPTMGLLPQRKIAILSSYYASKTTHF